VSPPKATRHTKAGCIGENETDDPGGGLNIAREKSAGVDPPSEHEKTCASNQTPHCDRVGYAAKPLVAPTIMTDTLARARTSR
jgi:hypothetical protein